MPTPAWSGLAREILEEDEAARYRREADAKLKRLQNTPMVTLGPDTPIPAPQGNGQRGWKINPRGIETPRGLSGGSALPAFVPELNDPDRDYSDLGPSPRLTQQDIIGDPAPAGRSDGVGGPEQDIADLARAELERRRSGGASPSGSIEDMARMELAKRSASAPQGAQPFTGPASDDFAIDLLRRQGALQEAPFGNAGLLPEAPANRPTGSITGPGIDREGLAALIEGAVANPPDRLPDGAQAFMANAYNSATFGQGDKLRGLAAAIMGGDYDQTVQDSRDWLAKTHEVEPGWSFGGDLAGFILPGVGIGNVVGKGLQGTVNAAQRASPVLGFLAKTGNMAAQGAAGGAAHGFTVGAENIAMDAGEASPELFDQRRFDQAGAEAPLGALVGSAMPALGAAFRPLANAGGGAVAKVLEPFKPGSVAAHNQRVASEAARRSLERAGILTVDDLAKRAAKYGDKPVVTGELGQDPLNSLVALVRGKGTTGEKAAAILEDRVSGMPGRMLKDIADETGMSPDQVMGTVEDMVKKGRERAAPLYEAAEQAPFAETANLERIVRDAPILRGLLPKAQGRLQNQAVPMIGQGDQLPPIKLYDELKQLVDEEIQARIANGVGIEDIQGVRDALVRELDTISGQAATGMEVPPAGSSLYAKAREAGGDAPRVQEGLRQGERALSGARLADDVAREVAGIRGEQLTAYQIGVIRNLTKEVENGRLTPKRVNTKGFKQKLNEVFGEPAAQGLIRKFGVEAELSQKGSRWNPNVGSVTSQAQMGGPTQLGDELVRLGANAASGNKIGIVTQLINNLRRRGYSEAQLNEIGDILLSSPDDAATRLFPDQTPTPGAVPPAPAPAGRVRENTPEAQMSEYGRARAAAMQAGDVNAYADAAMQEFPQVGRPDAIRMAVKDFVAERRADELLNKLPPQQSDAIRQALQANDTEAAIDAVNRVWPNLGREEAASFLDALGKAPLPKGVQFTDKQSTVWQMMNDGASHRDIAKKIGLEYDTLEEIDAANQYIDIINSSIAKKLHAAGHAPVDPNAARLRTILGPNADKVLSKKGTPPPKGEAPSQGGAPDKAGLFPSKPPLDMSEAARMQRAREHVRSQLSMEFREAVNPPDELVVRAAQTLSPQQFEVWKLANQGLGAKAIADRLADAGMAITEVTVRSVLVKIRARGIPVLNSKIRVQSEELARVLELRIAGLSNEQIAARVFPDRDPEKAKNIVKAWASQNRDIIQSFDPSQSGSSKLLAGVGGLGGLGLISAAITANKERK